MCADEHMTCPLVRPTPTHLTSTITITPHAHLSLHAIASPSCHLAILPSRLLASRPLRPSPRPSPCKSRLVSVAVNVSRPISVVGRHHKSAPPRNRSPTLCALSSTLPRWFLNGSACCGIRIGLFCSHSLCFVCSLFLLCFSLLRRPR